MSINLGWAIVEGLLPYLGVALVLAWLISGAILATTLFGWLPDDVRREPMRCLQWLALWLAVVVSSPLLLIAAYLDWLAERRGRGPR